MKRVMVDLSATLIHHGHIRLLKTAKNYGYVIVALTTDIEILSNKGYAPELGYEERAEILGALKYVDEIVPSPWLITEDFMDMHHADILLHGSDNSNPISERRKIIVPRTKEISSSILRGKVLKAVSEMYLNKK